MIIFELGDDLWQRLDTSTVDLTLAECKTVQRGGDEERVKVRVRKGPWTCCSPRYPRPPLLSLLLILHRSSNAFLYSFRSQLCIWAAVAQSLACSISGSSANFTTHQFIHEHIHPTQKKLTAHFEIIKEAGLFNELTIDKRAACERWRKVGPHCFLILPLRGLITGTMPVGYIEYFRGREEDALHWRGKSEVRV